MDTYHSGLYKDGYGDPVLHSMFIRGKLEACLEVRGYCEGNLIYL